MTHSFIIGLFFIFAIDWEHCFEKWRCKQTRTREKRLTTFSAAVWRPLLKFLFRLFSSKKERLGEVKIKVSITICRNFDSPNCKVALVRINDYNIALILSLSRRSSPLIHPPYYAPSFTYKVLTWPSHA